MRHGHVMVMHHGHEKKGVQHMCQYKPALKRCECKCFGVDWAIQHGVRGAVDSGNHKIVEAFGGKKLAFTSRKHGDIWETDTSGQTARGFMTSDGGAYQWRRIRRRAGDSREATRLLTALV